MAKKTDLGPDASRPPCRKAKLIRREKREAKLAKQAQEALARGESPMETKAFKPNNFEKSLEDYLNEPLPANPAHNLEVRIDFVGDLQRIGEILYIIITTTINAIFHIGRAAVGIFQVFIQ